jgi:hypothetical protein
MGVSIAPVMGSGGVPACNAKVSKLWLFDSKFAIGNPQFAIWFSSVTTTTLP